MSGNLLAAIRSAVGGWTDDDEYSAGAAAPITEETVEMSTAQKPAGTETGISQADHDAAVAAARNEGRAAGAAEATERLSVALGAEGIKGDAGRMAAALDLAVKSPGMTGADVAAFVTANVPAAFQKTDAAHPAVYEAQRLAAAGPAQPGQQKPAGEVTKAGWAKAVASANARFANEKLG